MTQVAVGLLVFATSAAVLILEILSARLLAPYVGVTLETFTAIIGTVLAGISLGTWWGGRLADRIAPRRLLGPELVLGGGAVLFIVPIVWSVGPLVEGTGALKLVGLVLISMFLPAALLSAVSPTVVKLVLADLDQTGRVVGRFSAIGTAGAIVGTFLSGFVLEPLFRTSRIVLGLGLALVVAGLLLSWRLSRGPRMLIPLLIALVGAGLTLSVDFMDPCDLETAYYCVRIESDSADASGRFLVLDTLDHSYVNLDDPTELRFSYIRMFAAVIEAATTGSIDAVYIGGGALTMPRWLSATRPGSRGVVLELDPALLELAIGRLGWRSTPDVEIVTGDARLRIRRLPRSSADVVLGDAFGGIVVPWHLTTIEFVEEVAALLRPSGFYAVNVTDGAGLAFVRAEAATLSRVFTEVAIVSPSDQFERGGNFVLVGSRRHVPVSGIQRRGASLDLDLRVITGLELAPFLGGAQPLTDDHAPVDQLLTPQT